MKQLTTEQNKLVEENKKLAEILANKFIRTNGIKEYNIKNEIISEAYMGLCDAAIKFDTTKNVPFKSFASIRVYGQIQDFARKEGRFFGFTKKSKNFKLKTSGEITSNSDTNIYITLAKKKTHEDVYDNREMLAFIIRKMRKEDKKLARIFYLRKIKKRTYKEIAIKLNVKRGHINYYFASKLPSWLNKVRVNSKFYRDGVVIV